MRFPHSTSRPTRTTGRGYAALDDAWLEERWADPETRVLVVAGSRIRPVDGRGRLGPPADAPDGPARAAGGAGRPHLVRLVVDPAEAPTIAGGARDWVGLRAVLQHLAERRWRGRAAGLPRARPGRVALRRPVLPALRRRARAARGRPRADLHELRQGAVPAHRPGRDHDRRRRRAGRGGRALPARAPGGLARGPLLHAGRLRRAGRDAGGRRTPRGARGDRRRGRRGRLLRQPAVAVPVQPDAGLRRPRASTTDITVDDARDRGRAVVHPGRDEGRGRGRRRSCCPAASRSRQSSSRTGTAARCPATGSDRHATVASRTGRNCRPGATPPTVDRSLRR